MQNIEQKPAPAVMMHFPPSHSSALLQFAPVAFLLGDGLVVVALPPLPVGAGVLQSVLDAVASFAEGPPGLAPSSPLVPPVPPAGGAGIPGCLAGVGVVPPLDG